MSIAKTIAGSFIGKIAAAILIAALAALGFGPEKLVAPLLGVTQEGWLLAARIGLVLLGLFVFLLVFAMPYLSRPEWVFAWRYALDSTSWLPFRRIIKVKEAARLFYEEMRLTMMGAYAEFGRSGNATLDYFGKHLAEHAQLFGKHPPSMRREAISRLEAKNMQVQGGATELASIHNEEAKYIDLEIMARDFRRLLRKAKRDWPEEEANKPVRAEGAVESTQTRALSQVLRMEDALNWIIESNGWKSKLGNGADLIQAALALRQAARDGEITVRGRREINRDGIFERFDQTWEDIDHDYWRTHELELTAVISDEAHYAIPETTAIAAGNLSAEMMPAYAMLRVKRDELEAKWPKGST